jgi:KaiC/GvpD/RAD55 family RecA-like ATPase
MAFAKATKEQAKARVALIGPPGSGKTYDALTIAQVLAGLSGKVAVIDTENGSASKYADLFEFDTQNLQSFTPQSYIRAIQEAETADYDVLVIDSLSHGWTGKDGVLAMVDNVTSRAKSGNAFTTGWREVTPQHNALVDALVRCKCHLVVTMRVKTEYVIEEVNGKKMPRKVGLAPVQRDGLEYEFDVVGDIDMEHKLVITKSRCPELSDGVFHKPGREVWGKLADWLNSGVAPKQPEKASADDVADMLDLLKTATLPKGWAEGCLKAAGVGRWEDMPADKLAKCKEFAGARIPNKQPATGERRIEEVTHV